MVGVITPAYNRVRLLADTCRSVQNQDFPHVHVVVDDGSDDGTFELAKELEEASDGRLVVLRLPRIERALATASRAMNAGLEYLLARPDVSLITRLDSDDILAPGSLRVRAERFDDVVAAVFARQGGFTSEASWDTSDRLYDDQELTKSLVFRRTLTYHSLMYRAALADGVIYAPRVDYQEDLDFTLRLLESAARAGMRFAFADELVVWTRAHEESISGRINVVRATAMTARVWAMHRGEVSPGDLITQLWSCVWKYRLWHPLLRKWDGLRTRSWSTTPPSDGLPADLRWFDTEH